ncbi:MAG TPA: ABC transporter ATP-binding protein [Candidatus Fraserbacteria bacterium]|mgnify:CR=1 FL=1|nr:ABC transporter ATP-binding protein [Candidatus Fraserbacteria bacterium]
MSLIRTEGLEKIYRLDHVEVPALRGVDLTIEGEEFLAIAGPSGSGKTTLLNLIGGLDRPTAGQVFLEEQEITRLNKSRLAELRLRKIGFVFQAYNLLPVLTALENVEYVMLLQGIAAGERRQRALAILGEVGLAEYANRFPNLMSGGQQQRVAVARAIVAQPKLVLADEPTANLDSTASSELLDLMRQLNRDHGVTFVFSTHDPLVMERAERLVRLRDGKVFGDE